MAKKDQSPLEITEELEGRIVNAVLGATINMHSETLEQQKVIESLTEEIKSLMNQFEERLQAVEDQRKQQLLASRSQLEEIEKAESQGFTIDDKTFIAHVLGTNQLIFEIMGKVQSDLVEVKDGLRTIDHRTQSFEMEQALMREQLGDIKKKWMPIISKQSKVIALALLTIALSLGLGSFLRAVTWW